MNDNFCFFLLLEKKQAYSTSEVMLIGPPTLSDLIGSGLVWYPIRSDKIGSFRGWTRPDQTQS